MIVPEEITMRELLRLQELSRLRAIEKAAREVIGETVLVGDHDDSFATFDRHFVMVEKYAVEALQAALKS
jgi:hypothetical protein